MAVSPLLGYNTNVRHLGKLYHIQTEDSGSGHAHIFTHLFADGGRIIASKKTTYEQYVGTSHYPDVVKRLMRESHKAMFIALRDGLFDEDEAAGAKTIAAMEITLDETTTRPKAPKAPKAAPEAPPAEAPAAVSGPVDVEALERAAAAQLAATEAARAPSSAAPKKYASTRPAAVVASPLKTPPPDPASESIFGGDLLSEKSLDEVILSYLAEDVEDEA